MDKYVRCIGTGDYRVSLTLHKVYKVIADPTSAELGQIRVVDDSGAGYIFPANWFVPVEPPRQGEEAG